MTQIAQRIISLLPGATEWVGALGYQDALVAVSHECDFPAEVQSLPRVTRSRIDSNQSSQQIDAAVRSHSEEKLSLYDLDQRAVAGLRPDLILTQSLCNVCAVSERDVVRSVEALDSPCRILDLRAQTFEEAFADAEAIAEAVGPTETSDAVIAALGQRVDCVRDTSQRRGGPRPVVTLLEWVDPLFCAGHWTPQLIEWSGGDDPIGNTGQPSRQITMEELTAADPDILLVACCGMNAQRTQGELASLRVTDGWSELKAVRAGEVHVFDGSALFNRPGPRLVDALEAVASLIQQWSATERV